MRCRKIKGGGEQGGSNGSVVGKSHLYSWKVSEVDKPGEAKKN